MFSRYAAYKIYSEDFCDAIIDNNEECLDDFLATVHDLNQVRDSFKRSLVHLAAAYGNVSLLRRLLDAKCNIEAADIVGNTPLMTAVFFQQDDVIRVLDAKGANFYPRNIYGFTPLYFAFLYRDSAYWMICRKPNKTASEKRHLAITYQEAYEILHCKRLPDGVQTKIDHKRLDTRDFESTHNPRVRRFASQQIEFLTMYNKSCNYWSRTGLYRFSVLQMSATAYHRKHPIGDIIFDVAGPLEETEFKSKWTAVHVAAMSLNDYSLRRLLGRGGDPNALDRNGETPLSLFALTASQEFAKIKNTLTVASVINLLIIYGARLYPHPELYKVMEGLIEHTQFLSDEDSSSWFEFGVLGNMLKQLVILELENRVPEATFQKIREPSVIQTYWQLCIAELTLMKRHALYKGITVYELYRCDVQTMLRYAKYAEYLKKAMNDVKQLFPIYRHYLALKIDEMMIMKSRLDNAFDIMMRILPFNNHVIAQSVVDELHLDTLHKLTLV